MHTLFLYIDPGSGSYLVQVIVAAVLGGAFWIKTFWRKIRSLFTRSGKEGKWDGDQTSSEKPIE